MAQEEQPQVQQFDAVAEQLRIATAADAARAAATAERRREQEAEEEEWRRRQEEEWRQGQFVQLFITQLEQTTKYLELLISRLEAANAKLREPPTQRAPIPPIPHPPTEWKVQFRNRNSKHSFS